MWGLYGGSQSRDVVQVGGLAEEADRYWEEAAEAAGRASGDGLIPPPTNPQQLIAWVGSVGGNPPCPALSSGIRRLLSGEQLACNDPLIWMTQCISFPWSKKKWSYGRLQTISGQC